MLSCFLQEPDVRFAAICDVRKPRREAIKQMADAKNGNQDCAMYRDLRELLARSDIDAVLIATGPNWHATAAILAANAGKDVYCEKPSTKNIAQSLALAETFRRTARVFQAGTQRRNLPHFAFAVDLARRGKLGKLQTLHAHPAGLGTNMSGWAAEEPEPAPEDLDWDLYLGPAAWRPFNKRLLDGFNFEKGGGMVGGGCHGMGFPLRGPLPVGQRCRPHGSGRVRTGWRRGACPLCERREVGPAERRLVGARLVSRPLRRRRGLGRGPAIAASWQSVRRRCSPAKRWRKSAVTRRRSTCATS